MWVANAVGRFGVLVLLVAAPVAASAPSPPRFETGVTLVTLSETPTKIHLVSNWVDVFERREGGASTP